MNFQQKTAFISGGGSEMARAISRQLFELGANLVLMDCSEKSLTDTIASLGEFGTDEVEKRVFTYVADVRSYDELQQCVVAATNHFGNIDILINVAGIIRHHPIDEMPVDEWLSVIDINLTGYFNVCKAVVPGMKAMGAGKIVNVSSIGGRTGRPGCGCNYAAAKAGIIGLSQTLALELAPWKINVNVVAPGPLKGRMFYSIDNATQRKLEANIPLGFLGDMEQIAHSILFLASEDASYITGEVLDVNGGLYI